MSDGDNPWTVLRRDTVYENPWIRVDHHDVLTPRRTPGVYGTIHFKAHAVGVLPVFADGSTVLVGQHRFPHDAWSWEIPEGGSHGEAPAVAAARELAEETGLVAAGWMALLEMDLSNSTTDERATSFLAWDLTEGVATPDETEALATRRLPLGAALAMVERGDIRDAISIATLLRVALLDARGGLPAEVAGAVAAGLRGT